MAAKEMRGLAHDIVSLAELQFELFRIECRDGLKQILITVVLLVVAGIVAVGTVPIVLLLIVQLLVRVAGLSQTAAFLLAAISGFVLALAIGVAGWSRLRGVVRVFERSQKELARNMTWIKQALKRRSPTSHRNLQSDDTARDLEIKDLI